MNNIYAHQQTAERQTKAQWLEEIESEGYNLAGEEEQTAEDYFYHCVEIGGLILIQD